MTSSLKRVFTGIRKFALDIDTANAIRHGAPVPSHVRNRNETGEPVRHS